MLWVGLQAEGSIVKWAKVSGKKTIQQLGAICLAEEVKPLYFDAEERLITGLEASEMLLREVDLATSNVRSIEKSIPFQVETQVPYAPEEAVVSLQIFPEGKKGAKVSLFATRMAYLLEHKRLWSDFFIEPDKISCIPMALYRFGTHFFSHSDRRLILHVGMENSTAVGVFHNRVQFSYSLPFGLEQLSNACARENSGFAQWDFSRIRKEENPILWESIEQIRRELDRLSLFLQKKGKGEPFELLLTGNLMVFPKLRDFIVSLFPSDLIQVLPFDGPRGQETEQYDFATLYTYAIPIGLALDAVALDGFSVEFCRGDLVSVATKKRKKRAIGSFSLAMGVAALLVVGLGQGFLAQKKKFLKHRYQCKVGDCAHWNLRQMEEALEREEVLFKKTRLPYSLVPPFPLVSAILASLSASSLTFDLTSFKYVLEKYPKIGDGKSGYVGKVEMELKTLEGEGFKDALLRQNSFIDPKKMSYQESGDLRKISFILKPEIVQ